MRQSIKVALALGFALGAAGCSDYLSGPGVDQDPNNVINLNKAGPLYVGVQAAGPIMFEGQLARLALLYTQQAAGVDRQQADFDLYGATQADIDTYYGGFYGTSNVVTGGGGLLDIHKMQQLGLAVDDSLYVGIGKVYEAMYMGYAASLFGDIPYREAADSNIRTPAYDPQLQVYADLQAQLDSAIGIYLAATGPTNAGPAADGVELIYSDRGDDPDALRAVYTEVAYTLKARLHMHTAEALGLPAYQAAYAAAQNGISTPANDFLWYHDPTATGANIWWQFQNTRTGDLSAGAALIEILKRRIAGGQEGPERLAFYFKPAAGGGFFGFRPGRSTVAAAPGVYNGAGSATGTYSDFAAPFDGTTATAALSGIRIPAVTFAETELIAAEAALAIGNGQEQTHLNNARANRAWGAQTFPALGPVAATLQNIMEEKYTTLFLNPEVWNDYKRTCLPSLASAPADAGAGVVPRPTPIPGRLPYGQSEATSNPNVPSTNSAGAAITPVSQNPNDPNPCPQLDYTSSTPLAN